MPSHLDTFEEGADTHAEMKHAWLIPIAGPAIEPFELVAKKDGMSLGRHEQCDLVLPADTHVSRLHARLTFASGRWWIADLKSRWGTMVNGVAVQPSPPLPLGAGDLIRIAPWTFSFSQAGPQDSALRTIDDTADRQTAVRTFATAPGVRLAEHRLALLLESTASIHAARSERELAERVLEVACRGTGQQNAAMLRPLDNAGGIEVMATRMSSRSESAASEPAYSRSLLAAASQGVVAELSDGRAAAVPVSQSIVQMNIRAAICVPLLLEGPAGHSPSGAAGKTIAAYLYLDSRGRDAPGLSGDDTLFCVALGRIAGLALANLKRIDIERRQATMLAEINAAASAQRWILPRRENRIGPLLCIGETRPGALLGGDFFDIIPLADARFAVALGDVTGHGIAASVLMATAQGFLHSTMQEHADPARAVRELNQFIHPRTPPGRFITLWLAVVDGQRRMITYVDAGHGYAMLIDPTHGDGGVSFTPLRGGDGLPVGLFETAEYAAEQQPFAPPQRLLIVSDGIVEQQSGANASPETAGQFGMRGIETVLRRSDEGAERGSDEAANDRDDIAALFEAVTHHAAAPHFADDTTAVLVRFLNS